MFTEDFQRPVCPVCGKPMIFVGIDYIGDRDGFPKEVYPVRAFIVLSGLWGDDEEFPGDVVQYFYCPEDEIAVELR